MKKLVMAFIGVLGLGSVALAAPVGDVFNFTSGEESQFITRLQADFVFDRDGADSGESIESQSYAAQIGYEVSKQFTPYVLLGAFEGEYDYSGVVAIESDMNFMWGAGISGVLWTSEGGIEIGYDAKYRQAELDIDSVTILGSGITVPDSSVDYADWQAAVLVSKNFNGIRPYAGVKYSDYELDNLTLAGTAIDGSSEADDNLGVVAGLSIDIVDSLSADVEGRLLDEEALTASLTWRF